MAMIDLIHGDALDEMRKMPDNSVGGVFCDPPYGLSFMGKEWDHGVPGEPFWAEALRVSKPGAMLLAFGGTRTYHRLACAIEDAGWEIRDCLMWVYGSGFPKSANISKLIDKAAGVEREVIGVAKGAGKQNPAWNGTAAGRKENSLKPNYDETVPATPAAQTWDGYGTALKPAWEPVIVAMKPIDGTFANNAVTHGVAGLNVDGCRVGIADGDTMGNWDEWRERKAGMIPNNTSYCIANNPESFTVQPRTKPNGRWPANVIHDGSPEVLSGFPVSVARPVKPENIGISGDGKNREGWGLGSKVQSGYYDTETSAARFFYCAKASRRERKAGLEGMEERQKYAKNGQGGSHEISTSESANDSEWAKKNPNHPQANHHPTVKPLALCEYLARLILPPAAYRDTATLLTPFSGSGSEMIGAMQAGWRNLIGIEQEAEYIEIARRRLAYWQAEKEAPEQMPLLRGLGG